jgi:hypothetical protein
MNIPSSAQPFQIYPSGPVGSTSLTIKDDSGSSRTITPSGAFYRFRSTLPHFSAEFHSDVLQSYLEVRLWLPIIGHFVLFQRFSFCLILLCSSAFAYITPLLRAALPSNFVCLLFALYRLQVIGTSPLFDAFAITLFWAAYLHIILSQSRAVCAPAPWMPATLHAITVGTSIALFIGLYEPSVSIFMSVIWLFVPLVASYLFQIGKVTVHPALLGVHFGFLTVVSGAVYFSALSRGYWAPTAVTLWSETADLSALAVFAVFQNLFLVGDRAAGTAANASLGRLSRRGQIDSLLSVLAVREEEERMAAFA